MVYPVVHTPFHVLKIIILRFVIYKNPTHSTVFCQRKFKIEALLGAQEQGGGLEKIWNGRKLRKEGFKDYTYL
jgi:hypothetical protein